MSDDTRFDQDDEESDLLIPIARSETFDTFWNSPRRSNSSSVEIVETELSQKFLKTMAEIYNDLDSPGQSMSLLHASLTSLSELLIFVKKVGLKMERSETWSIESQDPRLQYIRALVHGDTLMRLAGFSWKKSLQAWVLLLSRNIDLAPYIVLVQRHQSKTEIQIFDELAPPRINYSSFSKTCELNKLETKVVGSFLGGIFGDLLGIPFDGWKTEIMEKWFVCVREIYALPPSSALPEEKWHDLSFQRTLGVYSTEVSSMLALTRMILNKDCPSNYTALREDLTYELGHERPRGYLSSMKAKFPFDSLHIKSKEHILANTLPSSMCSDHEDLIGVALLVPLAFKKTGIDLFRAIAQFLLPTFHMNVVITAYIHCLSISYLHKCVDANPLENLKTFLAGRLDSIPHEFRMLPMRLDVLYFRKQKMYILSFRFTEL